MSVRSVYHVDMANTDDTTVRLPRALVEQVRAIAVVHDRSLAAELRVGLADYVKRMRDELDDAEGGK
jgi:predicted transcriptional regulator